MPKRFAGIAENDSEDVLGAPSSCTHWYRPVRFREVLPSAPACAGFSIPALIQYCEYIGSCCAIERHAARQIRMKMTAFFMTFILLYKYILYTTAHPFLW